MIIGMIKLCDKEIIDLNKQHTELFDLMKSRSITQDDFDSNIADVNSSIEDARDIVARLTGTLPARPLPRSII
jgi:hypothetical protein